jgi:hypothetical protein
MPDVAILLILLDSPGACRIIDALASVDVTGCQVVVERELETIGIIFYPRLRESETIVFRV